MAGLLHLLTPSEAAQELRVSVATIYRLVEQRCIVAIKVGDQVADQRR
jgi:excisionase family DNA binding protein